MKVDIYETRLTAQAKLEGLTELYEELQETWRNSTDNTIRYNVSLKASEAFQGFGFAFRVHLWYNDPEVGGALREAALKVWEATNWYYNWIFSNASLPEKFLMNRDYEEWRISRR